MSTAARWRPRVASRDTLFPAADLGDGWELLAGRDCRPYLRTPSGRLREVDLAQAPEPGWLEAIRARLIEKALPEVREALQHALIRWGGEP